jgi:hypothetical protein
MAIHDAKGFYSILLFIGRFAREGRERGRFSRFASRPLLLGHGRFPTDVLVQPRSSLAASPRLIKSASFVTRLLLLRG